MPVSRLIQTRWALVALIAAGQLLALVIGSIWLVNWLEISVERIVRQRVTAVTAQYAVQLGTVIDELGIESAQRGSPGWQQLQQLVERLNLPPHEGFLCIVDQQSGDVLCHPELLQQLQQSETAAAAAQPEFLVFDAGEPETSADDSGQSRLPRPLPMPHDGAYIVASHELPRLSATLLVYRPEQAVLGAVDAVTRAAGIIVFTLSGVVILISTAFTSAIVYRYENRLARINEGLEQQVETRSAVIFGLAKLAESRDDQTGEHLDRIRQYVLILAREMANTHPEITPEFIETLAETTSLHDIGKVGIPDSVLLNPGKLTDEQRKVIRKHPLIGGDTLLAIKQRWGDDPFLVTACEVAFSHHERWDGTGYPFGLAGEDIPLAGRIVALADVYDALTSRRVYKDAMTHEQASRIILAGEGTHFDPAVVRAFVNQEAAFKKILTAGAA